jgi:hypothetical protein
VIEIERLNFGISRAAARIRQDSVIPLRQPEIPATGGPQE